MKKATLTILVTLMLTAYASARMEMLPHYLAFPVLVKIQGGGDASALYYGTTNHFYLITAKHVIFDPANGKLRGEELELESYDKDIATKPNKTKKKVHLKNLQDDGLIYSSPSSDVVALRLGDSKKNDDGTTYVVYNSRYMEDLDGKASFSVVSSANIAKYDDVLISNDAYIFGYPSSIGLKQLPQIDYDLPLLRRGIIAGKNGKTRTIILDCPSYYGNSGGPVCQVERDGLTTKYQIIGIVSQFVPFVEVWENKTHKYVNMELSNSGYTVVVPIDVATDLIETAEQPPERDK